MYAHACRTEEGCKWSAMMESTSQSSISQQTHKRHHSKFNPPLKKTANAPLEDSCGSPASWSLPPTQTHTVLSYCDQEELQSQEISSATKQEATGQAVKTSSPVKRRYDYGVYASKLKGTKKAIQYHPKSRPHTATGNNVYDYCLTPRPKRTRTKAQVSNCQF